MDTDQLIASPPLNTGKPEISMAPLVDIVFLLLIFFMVTTVFPENDGILIEKPTSENTASLADKNMVLKLDHNGLVYYKDVAVTFDDIKRLVKREIANNQDTSVIVHADKRATTEQLINVIDSAKSGGAKKLGIATDEKHSDK